MKRRTFVNVIALCLLVSPCAHPAQTSKMYRIGWLSAGSSETNKALLLAFQDGLREHGLIEGQNISIEYRWAAGNLDRLPSLAAELVELKPDVIVTAPASSGVVVKRLTSTIPIVLATSGDPVMAGLAESLSRPGGNVTGLSNISTHLVPKQLELLRSTLPAARKIGVLVKDANNPLGLDERSDATTAAQRLGLQLQFIEMQSSENFDRAFTEIQQAHVQALLVTTDPLLFVHRTRILAAVATMRLPAMYGLREFVDGGGLVSYGVSLRENFRQAASYVEKILVKGARPGDLPIQQPNTYELVINLETAKVLGITIPQSLLLRADEVIQ